MKLALLDFIVLAGYAVGLFGIGRVAARRQRSPEIYFLAGRRVPWWLAGVSVLATLLSTLTYLAVPSEMIGFGVGYFYSLLAFVLVIPIVNRIILPALMRLPFTSVYDYLEHRFGLSARLLAATVFVATRTIWIGLIVYTASFAVSEMTGWPIVVVMLTVGLVTTAYTTQGGLEAVMWADFAQFLLLFGGAVFIPAYVFWATGTGPVEWWQTFSTTGRTEAPIFSWDLTVRITIVGIVLEALVWNVCTHGADQVAAQRYLSTSSAAEARKSVWTFSVLNIAMILLLMFCGLAVFGFYQQAAPETLATWSADAFLPRFIAEQLPAGTRGLILAALLAAAMSSMSSGVNSIATVVATDFLQRLGREARADRALRTAKLLAGAAGGVGIALAVAIDLLKHEADWNLIELIGRINHLFVAPLGALFMGGMVLRHAGTVAAIVGFLAGSVASVLLAFSQETFRLETSISFMWIMPASFVVSLATTCLLGWLIPARQGNRGV